MREEDKLKRCCDDCPHRNDTQQAEKLLQKRNRELARSNQDLEQFAYVASHDLQTPLRKVKNFTMLLQSEYSHLFDEEARRYMKFIVEGAEKSQALINDLLSFSRAGREVNISSFPLDHALDDALYILDEDIIEKNVTIDRQPLPVVWGDRLLFARVFQNLIGNAIKFRVKDRPAYIRIGTQEGEHDHIIYVSDNGSGVDMRHAKRIFTIFQRAGTVKNGNGLGLALSKKIVERHGGRIWVESVLNSGATFYFNLLKEYVNGDGSPELDSAESTS